MAKDERKGKGREGGTKAGKFKGRNEQLKRGGERKESKQFFGELRKEYNSHRI